MAPIDWDRVMTANVEGLSEDDADEFYEVLAEVTLALFDMADVVHRLQVSVSRLFRYLSFC